MISIQVEKVRVPSSNSINDLSKIIQAQGANAVAEGFANELKKAGVDKKACTHHPRHTSTVIVRALDSKETLRVEKRGFCCREFEAAVQIVIKR